MFRTAGETILKRKALVTNVDPVDVVCGVTACVSRLPTLYT